MNALALSDRRFKHGLVLRHNKPPEFNVWCKMRERCSNQNNKDFKNYGGRGISVCARWRNDFAAFLSDMGPRPSAAHSIERVNNNAGYSPDNCVWATRATQNRNRRARALNATCQRGHPLSGPNLYVRKNGKRCCKACRKMNMRDFYMRKRGEK